MRVTDCLDKQFTEFSHMNLTSNSLEENELILAVSSLIYKTKSIRKSIDMLNYLTNSEYCVEHSYPPKIVFNNSEKSDEEILSNLQPKGFPERLPYSGC